RQREFEEGDTAARPCQPTQQAASAQKPDPGVAAVDQLHICCTGVTVCVPNGWFLKTVVDESATSFDITPLIGISGKGWL
ncbi:hypothetical protein LTR94_036824, partial [Friedmanniomyces endolithicus]